jgi:hypothetical protein
MSTDDVLERPWDMPSGARVSAARPARRTAYWIRTVAYWLFTLAVAYEMVAGSLWDLLRIEYVRGTLSHLGYPLYLAIILGVWKFPCALALLAPRFPRVKEWAYAGAFFNYSGAMASHLSVGDGPQKWVWPLAFALFTIASWALRPPERRVAPVPIAEKETRTIAWLVPVVVVAVFAVLSLLSLPKGLPS